MAHRERETVEVNAIELWNHRKALLSSLDYSVTSVCVSEFLYNHYHSLGNLSTFSVAHLKVWS